MPVIVGDGSAGVEGKSDRIGIPTGSSDPAPAEVGDLYFNIPNSTLKVYNGTAWEDLGSGTIAPNGSSSFPAVSAAQLLSDYPNLNSGVYYLQTSGGSVQAYCEMERMGGGWVIGFQHQCTNDEGLAETLFTGAASGTPNSGSADFQGAGSLTATQLWDNYVGSGQEAMIYAREIQTAGGSYDETHSYISSTGGTIFSKANFQDLLNPAPANGGYESGITVLYRNGSRKADLKQQTVWSSPSLITINNGAIDQELYYCNGQDGGDSNWSFALMRGGTPYPRLANSANGGGRHGGITRWGQLGFRAASVSVPSDPFGDMSGVGYFPLNNTFTNKAVGYTQYNGTNTGGTYTADGITWANVGGNGFRIPAPNSESIGEWFQGDQDWAISMVFRIANNPGTATNRALIHMANGDDHARPAFWVTGPNRGAGVANKMEWFSSSNGSSWDIARGDTNASGLGSTTIVNGTSYHVVFTRSSSSGLKGYVNKTVDWSDSSTASHYASGDYEINIGNWFNYLTNYGWHGSIKNVRFFRKNLVQADVDALYALDF